MEDLIKSLPPEVLAPFGGILLIAFVVRYLGLWQGQKTGPEQAQVAAVIVDPTALNRLTAAAEAMNMTLIELCKILRDKVQADVGIAKELDEMREEMRIQREVSRRS